MKTRKEIHPMTIADTANLGIDEDGKLYWKGAPVKTESAIKLSFLVNSAVIITALATSVQAYCAWCALQH